MPLSLRSDKKSLQVLTLHYAASGTSSNGQTGSLTAVCFSSKATPMYQYIDWLSSTRKRVSFSSAVAEILPSAYIANRVIRLSEVRTIILSKKGGRSRVYVTLLVHANRFLTLQSPLHRQNEFWLQPIVALLNESFKSNEINNQQ